MELETIRSMIYEVRGVRVMLDFDLARLYQVENRTLKQAVRRNMDRFPDDFMLKLTKEEAKRLMLIGISQNVISPGYNPGPGQVFAFTEEGVAMLSAVLRSPVAVNVSIEIMRAFVEIRNHLAATGRLSVELAELRAGWICCRKLEKRMQSISMRCQKSCGRSWTMCTQLCRNLPEGQRISLCSGGESDT